MSISPICSNDNDFGPVSTCRLFDFTLAFSNSILSILPSVIALLAISYRFCKLSSKSKVKDKLDESFWQDRLGLARIGSSFIHAVVSSILLILVGVDNNLRVNLVEATILPALTLGFIVSALVPILSSLERTRTRGGSFVLPCWLFATILFDSARARTFTAIPPVHRSTWFGFFISSLILKGTMVVVENTNGVKTQSSRESRAGFLSTILFWWLLPLIWHGFRNPLRSEDLEELQPQYEAGSSHERLSEKLFGKLEDQSLPSIDLGDTFVLEDLKCSSTRGELGTSRFTRTERGSAKPPVRSLILATLLAFPVQILKPISWRLILIAAQLSQPFLVSNTLSFAQSFATGDPQPLAYGWGLVGATTLVYGVVGLSTGQFFWTVSQSEVIIRGSYVGLIWEKALKIDQTAASSAEFSPSNLMSTDLERLTKVFQSLHILWSGTLTLIIGTYLLYLQLGLIFLAPLITIFLAILLTPLLSKGLGAKQSAWSAATDKRVGLISSAISHMKALKFSAYEGAVSKQLLEARREEGLKMRTFYKQFVVIILQTNLLTEVLSVVTYGFLAYLTPEKFTVNVVFTSLTLIGIVQEPLLIIGQQWASLLTALSSLRRIEAFLNQEESPVVGPGSSSTDLEEEKASTTEVSAVSFKRATLSYRSSEIIRDVTLEIPFNALTIVCGRVSSGKSSFLNAILGELHVTQGSLSRNLSGQVAYLSQDVWLQNSLSIQENIIFTSEFDQEYYKICLKATALDIDLLELDSGDRTIASNLSGGQRSRVGLCRALYSRADTFVLDDSLASLDAATAAWIWDSLFGPRGLLLSKTVVMATNSVHLLPLGELVIRLEGGKIAESGKFSDLSMKGKDTILKPTPQKTEYRNQLVTDVQLDTKPQNNDNQEATARGVGWKIYKNWIQVSGTPLFVILCFCTALSSCGTVGLQLLLQAWATINEESITNCRDSFFAGTVLVGLSVAMTSGIAFWIFLGPMTFNSGQELHAEELKGLMKASISTFESESVGHILNNFSQILFLIDFELPLAALNVIFNGSFLIANVVVTSIPAPYLLLVFSFLSFIYLCLQRIYIPCSRTLRRLELNQKSPLYSTFAECTTVQGLSTLRASLSEEQFSTMNYKLINASQKPFYYLWAARRWLMTSLNLLGMVVNVALVLIVVLLRNNSSVGLLGVALVSATQIGGLLNRLMIAYSEMEIGAVAIERIQQMANLRQEEEVGSKKLNLEPSEVKGKIEIENLTVRYRQELEPTLQEFSASIPPSSRIGIVGRSGSGKSTLLLALCKMLEPQSGRILLDGIDISELSVQSLRSNMTIISQTPLLLNTSVRSNLDPEGSLEDRELWDAISKVQLRSFVKKLPDHLETVLSGSIVTTPGQRQLLSLARAILRKRKILVLDESSSALDEATDLAMQKIIATSFENTTIIAVAHRVQFIRNFDQILVMSNGRLIEKGSPEELIAREESVFRSLAVEQRCV